MAGDLASGSFYVPNRGVKLWVWKTYWLVGGISGWILAPWLLALIMTRGLIGVLHEAQYLLRLYIRLACGIDGHHRLRKLPGRITVSRLGRLPMVRLSISGYDPTPSVPFPMTP